MFWFSIDVDNAWHGGLHSIRQFVALHARCQIFVFWVRLGMLSVEHGELVERFSLVFTRLEFWRIEIQNRRAG